MAAVVKGTPWVRGVELTPVDVEELAIRDLFGVKGDQYGLYVLGRAGADLLVGRVFAFAAGVAGNG